MRPVVNRWVDDRTYCCCVSVLASIGGNGSTIIPQKAKSPLTPVACSSTTKDAGEEEREPGRSAKATQ